MEDILFLINSAKLFSLYTFVVRFQVYHSRTWGTITADKKFAPMEDHFLIVLAGEQNSGKTAFSFDLALKNAVSMKVLFISLEMSGMDIYSRIARSYAGISKYEWRDRLNIPEQKKISYKKKITELKTIQGLKVWGFGAGEIPCAENIFEIIKQERPGLVIVDNLDLISKESHIKQLEHETAVSKAFMEFTNEELIPVILIHHLNKSGRIEDINAIRGSGKITDNADTVYMCFRNMDKEANEEEKKQFILIEKKDRGFGSGGVHVFSFNDGTFEDYNQPGF